LFEIANESELKAIYEEYPCGLKWPVWFEIYEYCVEGEFSFMYINTKKPKGERIMRNFDEIVRY